MAENSNNLILKLGLVARVNLPSRFFSSRRPFRCPPGFMYIVFRQTSAGPEYIEYFEPNENGTLGKDEELYRVSIGGAPKRYVYRQPFTLIDGVVIELDTELFVRVTDGAKVTRLVVEDNDDPLLRLREDIRWLLEEEIKHQDYTTIFKPKTKKIELDTRNYGKKIKQKAKTGEYGLEITDVRTNIILPPELKKRWEDDIAQWQEAAAPEIEKMRLEKRRRETQLKEEIAELDLKAAQLESELDEGLERIKQSQEDRGRERDWSLDDEAEEREQKKRRDAEVIRQTEIKGEVLHEIDIRKTEQEAEIDSRRKEQESDIISRKKEQDAILMERKAEADFIRSEAEVQQRQDIRLEFEQKAHERQLQLEELRHHVTTDTIKAQIESSRRRKEELDKIHQLRLQMMDELDRLRIVKIEEEQKLQLTSGQQKAELEHQYKLLEYKEQELKLTIRTDRMRQQNEEVHQAQLTRIELGKMLVEARLMMLDRIATGEVQLTPKQLDKLFDINPMKEQGLTPERISGFIGDLKMYLKEGGVEEIRTALEELQTVVSPQLTSGDDDSVDFESLRLDVAVPEEVEIGKAFDLAMAIRYAASPYLSELGPNIKSGEVIVESPKSEATIRLRIELSAPDCEIREDSSYVYSFQKGENSPPFYFHLTPQKHGEISVIVRIYQQQDLVGNARIHTVVKETVAGQVTTNIYVFDPDPEDQIRINLRETVQESFDVEELKSVCFDVGIDHDNFPKTKKGFVVEVLNYCFRHGIMGRFLGRCQQLRPQVSF